MTRFKQVLDKFHEEESGQDLLEYGLVLLAVLAAVVTGSQTIAGTIGQGLTTLSTKIQGVISGA